MNTQFRGFGSAEVFTLTIGPLQEQLLVPRNVLMQIPYFRKALNSYSLAECGGKSLDLPNDNPKAIAEVIHFASTGNVPEVRELDNITSPYASKPHVTGLIKAYITAHKLMAEDVANQLFYVIERYLKWGMADAGDITLLSQANLQKDRLYKIVVEEFADNCTLNRPQSLPRVFVKECAKMSNADMTQVLIAIGQQMNVAKATNTW